MRSGTPAIGLASTGRLAISSASGSGGGGTGIGFEWSTCRRSACAPLARPHADRAPTTRRSARPGRSRNAPGRASARRRPRTRRRARAISPGCWPPSVRVRILDALAHRSPRRCPHRQTKLLPRRPRCRVRRDRLAAYLDERERRADPARRRGAGLSAPASSGLVHLRAPADRRRAGRGDRHDRHRVLAELGAAESVLLWNVVPTHPGTATTNRPPTRAEVAAAECVRGQLARGRRVIAVGRIAPTRSAHYVRHPSHGGARAFAAGLAGLIGR